jgi:type I restriction enzyme M protein
VLFRGQPEVEEETGEFDDDGNPKMKRRKADDEHLIRKALLDARRIDAVISLPLNVFYGAGVPACLLILCKQRPPERRDQVLLIYAARHYRELSAQNELRPQDVMRMLVHYHAYGDAAKVPGLVAEHGGRIRRQIDLREEDEVGRLQAEYQAHADRLAALDTEIAAACSNRDAAKTKGDKAAAETALAKLEKPREKLAAKLAERDERIAEARRRAEDDRQDVAKVGTELVALYADPDELLKHARVVGLGEIEENEFNLNIPRYVDTFEPEPRVEVNVALKALAEAERATQDAEHTLSRLLKEVGYAAD